MEHSKRTPKVPVPVPSCSTGTAEHIEATGNIQMDGIAITLLYGQMVESTIAMEKDERAQVVSQWFAKRTPYETKLLAPVFAALHEMMNGVTSAADAVRPQNQEQKA